MKYENQVCIFGNTAMKLGETPRFFEESSVFHKFGIYSIVYIELFYQTQPVAITLLRTLIWINTSSLKLHE